MSRPFLITVGEPAGIGPDCLLLAFQADPALFRDCLVIAPKAWLVERAHILGLDVPICEAEAPSRADALFCHDPLPSSDRIVTCGRPSLATAETVVACIRHAAEACLAGDAAAMITGPIDKAILREAGFPFPGHTEFLADLAGGCRTLMMLASAELRVALLTTHVPLMQVGAHLTIAHVEQSIRLLHDALVRHFGIAEPRIALCALNPHAGEQGHFGMEELEVLQPAADRAREAGLKVHGPAPADSLFAPALRPSFDAYLCCYHDQGLIPIKALSFGAAVNITLGLPFIRTSVDHGTALDRAGTGKVSYSSLVAAVRLAKALAA